MAGVFRVGDAQTRDLTMHRSLLLAGATAALFAAAPTFALARGWDQSDSHLHYDRGASARAARMLAQDTAAIAPAVAPSEALDPDGPTIVRGRPVPDTPANRARYGQPMSRAGKMTAPIGD